MESQQENSVILPPAPTRLVDYAGVLGRFYPNVQITCYGDPTVYENVAWEAGEPMPSKAELDTLIVQDTIEAKWEEIKIERDSRKAGGVMVGEHWFHSDDASRIQQIGLVMMGQNIPANLQWKTMSGAFVTMTPTLAGQIFQSIAIKDTQIFGVAEQKRQAMLVSEDPAEYDISGGWPLVYGE